VGLFVIVVLLIGLVIMFISFHKGVSGAKYLKRRNNFRPITSQVIKNVPVVETGSEKLLQHDVPIRVIRSVKDPPKQESVAASLPVKNKIEIVEPLCENRATRIGAGVREQIRRLGGDPNTCDDWESAVEYMKQLSGVEDIPKVYNLRQNPGERLVRQIEKAGGKVGALWTSFEAKIYLQLLKKGVTVFQPKIQNPPVDEFVEWLFYEGELWRSQFVTGAGRVFKAGEWYWSGEDRPWRVRCAKRTEKMVWFGEVGPYQGTLCSNRIKIVNGVECAGDYQADHECHDCSFAEKKAWVMKVYYGA